MPVKREDRCQETGLLVFARFSGFCTTTTHESLIQTRAFPQTKSILLFSYSSSGQEPLLATYDCITLPMKEYETDLHRNLLDRDLDINLGNPRSGRTPVNLHTFLTFSETMVLLLTIPSSYTT
jgi:hypothetical protein